MTDIISAGPESTAPGRLFIVTDEGGPLTPVPATSFTLINPGSELETPPGASPPPAPDADSPPNRDSCSGLFSGLFILSPPDPGILCSMESILVIRTACC